MERNIKLLTLLNFCMDLVFWAPIAIIYFNRVAGSYTLAMSIFSVVFLSSALFEIPTGIFSDLIGRKKTIILGSLIYLVSELTLALTHSYAFLLVAALFQGVARSFFSGNNEAFLFDTLKTVHKEKDFHTYLGKTSSVFQVALALSAIAGGFLANISFSLVLWVSVIPKCLMLIISFFLIEPPVQSPKSGNIYAHFGQALKLFRTSSKLRLLTISSVIRFAIGESSYQFRAAFIALLWPIWAIGIVNTIGNIGAAMSFYFSGKFINKYNPLKLLSIDVITNRIVNLTAYIFPTVASPLLLSTTSVLFGIAEVSKDTLLQKEFTDSERATQGSLGSVFSAIGFAVASLFLGILGDIAGPQTTLIIAQIILVVPLFFYWRIFKHENTWH